MKSKRVERRKARIAKKRPTRRTKTIRVIVSSLVIVIILAMAWKVVAKSIKPYRIGYSESKDIIEIKKQIAEAEAENKALKADIEYLKRPEGKLVEARKLGFVKEGEVAVVIEQPDRKQFEIDHIKNPPPAEESYWKSLKRKIAKFFSRF
jgi:cell division protein FtsL